MILSNLREEISQSMLDTGKGHLAVQILDSDGVVWDIVDLTYDPDSYCFYLRCEPSDE